MILFSINLLHHTSKIKGIFSQCHLSSPDHTIT